MPFYSARLDTHRTRCIESRHLAGRLGMKLDSAIPVGCDGSRAKLGEFP